MRRTIGLIVLIILTWLGGNSFQGIWSNDMGQVSMTLGFLLLSAFMIGELIVPLRLPRITGYLLAGLIFGPQAMGLLSQENLNDLKVIDSLALTFIALSAGGELQLSELRKNRKVILSALVSLIIIVFTGSTLLILAASPLFSFTRDLPWLDLVVLAAILGAIATARSPASAIAIIKETGAHGPFTEVALGLTVAMDILAIMLFALVVSTGQALLSGQPMDAGYLLALLMEIGCSLGLGVILGFGMAIWLKRVKSYHLITVFLLAVVVSEASHFLSGWLEHHFGLDFHLEPMLICIALGFVVRNFSKQGDPFLHVIERGGLMIYTLFFALAGAALDLKVLKHTWMLALFLVTIRFGTIQLGAWTGARIAGAERIYKRYLGITFVTQAGVSLGLAKVVESRFPGWGATVATLAIATISINQMIGPIFFRQALSLAGETASQRDADGDRESSTEN